MKVQPQRTSHQNYAKAMSCSSFMVRPKNTSDKQNIQTSSLFISSSASKVWPAKVALQSAISAVSGYPFTTAFDPFPKRFPKVVTWICNPFFCFWANTNVCDQHRSRELPDVASWIGNMWVLATTGKPALINGCTWCMGIYYAFRKYVNAFDVITGFHGMFKG